MTGVTGPGWAEQYAYDPAGNITVAAWPAPPGPAAAWADSGVQGQREYTGTVITRAGDVRYRHDAQGRITTRQRVRLSRKPDTWQYTWDAGNHLTAVTTPDGTRWRYLYDPFGRRIAKQRLAPDGRVTEQTHFTWDGPVLAEQTTTSSAAPAGTRPAWLAVPGGDGPSGIRPAWLAVPGDGRGQEPDQVITWDYRPGTFTPLTQVERTSSRNAPQEQVDEQFYAIVTDLIGSPSELVGPDGDLAGYQQHTLWGTTVWKPGGAATPLRFPGQYADPETGLHYNHHRYYDSATGRYLTPDPLGLTPAPNPHTYVPNPTVSVDPLGLIGELCPNDGGMIGEGGTRVTSKTLMQNDSFHIDVENPAPGSRPGQLHLQDYAGNKYQYNFETGKFEGLPNSLAKQISRDPAVARAIRTGLRYLGL